MLIPFLILLFITRSQALAMLTLEEVLTAGGVTPGEQAKVRNREFVKGTLESTNERELAAWFAFTVRGGQSRLKEIFLDSSLRQEADPTVLQMGNIEDGDIDPFASLTLDPSGPEMTMAYLSATPGSSGDLNLSKEEMKLFASLTKNATQKDVQAKLRDILLHRLNEYKRSGLKGISPYSRGRTDYQPGDELLLKSKMAPVLQKASPAFYKCLSEYPRSKPDGLEESYSWVNFNIDGKPTISLVHKLGLQQGDTYVFCQRHFYVSRGHNSVQGLGGAFPVEDGQVVVIYGSRTSTDQVAGFGGSAKRAIGSRVMGGRIAENMQNFVRHSEQQCKKS
jgi:hypothetical protein